jgi:hypothetical protein
MSVGDTKLVARMRLTTAVITMLRRTADLPICSGMYDPNPSGSATCNAEQQIRCLGPRRRAAAVRHKHQSHGEPHPRTDPRVVARAVPRERDPRGDPPRQALSFPYGSARLRECPSALETEVRGSRASRVDPGITTEEIAVSESAQDRPDEADEKAPKPGEQDTETVAGVPKKAPESKDGEQSKQDE